MEKRTRYFVYIAVGTVCLAAVVYVLLRPSTVSVETASAVRGLLLTTIEGQGETRVRERFVITAPVTGKLRRIELKVGDEVRQGDRVATLDVSPLDTRQASEASSTVRIAEAAKKEADANTDKIRTQLDQARRDRERSQNLMDYGRVSREDLERKVTAERTLTEELRAGETRIRAASQRIMQATATKKEAEAGVGRIEARLAQAKRESRRAAELVEAGVISKQEYEDTVLNVRTLEKELEAARFRVDAADADIGLARESEAEARSGQNRLREQLEQARREVKRARDVLDYGRTSTADVEQRMNIERSLEKELAASESRARAAEAEIDRARAAAGDGGNPTLVSAPVSGRVLKIVEESERVVQAGAPIIELSSSSNLEIVIDVLSTDAVRIKPGDKARISGWGSGETAEAVVRTVEPAAFTKVSSLGIEEQRVNIIADFSGEPPNLGDAFRILASIVVGEKRDALKIPSSALFRSGEDWAVFVVEAGRAKRVRVVVGERNEDEVEVLEGAEIGTEVVLHPSGDLADGVRVSVLRK